MKAKTVMQCKSTELRNQVLLVTKTETRVTRSWKEAR